MGPAPPVPAGPREGLPELSNGTEQPPTPPRRPMAPRNTSGAVAAAVAAAAVVAGASAQSWSIPTFPGMAAIPTFPAGGFTMPTFSGVPTFNPASLPSLPTIPSVPAFGEFSFPTLNLNSTMIDIVGMPEGLEGTAACSALWVPGNAAICTAAYTEGLTAYSEYLQGVSQLPVADVLAIEGMDYGAFVEGYNQMIEAWTPAMAGATFSG